MQTKTPLVHSNILVFFVHMQCKCATHLITLSPVCMPQFSKLLRPRDTLQNVIRPTCQLGALDLKDNATHGQHCSNTHTHTHTYMGDTKHQRKRKEYNKPCLYNRFRIINSRCTISADRQYFTSHTHKH